MGRRGHKHETALNHILEFPRIFTTHMFESRTTNILFAIWFAVNMLQACVVVCNCCILFHELSAPWFGRPLGDEPQFFSTFISCICDRLTKVVSKIYLVVYRCIGVVKLGLLAGYHPIQL